MRLALTAWFVCWAWIALPWRSFRLVPSFRNVELMPFTAGSLRSYVLNVLVFIPLGILVARLGWHPRTVVLVAAGLSAATEVAQLFSARRYPSTTDVILNTLGAAIGLLVVRLAAGPSVTPADATTAEPPRAS